MKRCCMKIKILTALLFCNFCYVQASNKDYESAHEQLAAYFKADIAKKQRVADARIMVLVMAVNSLQKGITRKQFKTIRNQLTQGLLPSPANEPILARLQTITENHARKFPLCCVHGCIRVQLIERQIVCMQQSMLF